MESFDVETIKLQTAGESTYGLRFYGGNANAEGRYLFETFSPLTNRQNLALPYEWNSMTGIQQFQVRNGTTMITGKAAAQKSFGSQYICLLYTSRIFMNWSGFLLSMHLSVGVPRYPTLHSIPESS